MNYLGLFIATVFFQTIQVFSANEFWNYRPRVANRRGKQNDGDWFCPWTLSGFSCKDGHFSCQCGQTGAKSVRYKIGCKYKFPGCGIIVHKGHNCARFYNCAECRTDISEWDRNACKRCKPGFEFGTGACSSDVNECSYENGGCEQRCVNTFGSYYCLCNPGYKLKTDKHACQKLKCSKPESLQNGRVEATDNWYFGSYARYQCNDRLILVGYANRKCLARTTSLYWQGVKPRCVDTCSEVKEADMVECGQSITDREECLQLGCCFGSRNKTAFCHADKRPVYLQYGGESVSYSERLKTQQESTVEGCSHLCIIDSRCKSFSIENQGQDAVIHQTCYTLRSTRQQLLKAKRVFKNSKSSLYDIISL